MKATLEIDEQLLRQVERLAAERNTTLRAIIEAALRDYLERDGSGRRIPFRLRRHTFRGRGLQAGLGSPEWSTIREHIYDRCGG